MEPMNGLLNSGALQLLLQHSLLHDLDTVCRLLCTSKALGNAVATAMAGQVPVAVSTSSMEQAQQFGRWAAKNGSLMQSLDLELDLEGAHLTHLAESVIAAGLRQAAQQSPPGGLLLQSLEHRSASSAAGDLLLPSSHLTNLVLVFPYPDTLILSGTAAALANLAGLCALTLAMPPATPEHVLPSLSGLTHLTHLAIAAGLRDVSRLKHLPASLVALDLWADDERGFEQPQQPLLLGHLTALTNLQCTQYHVKADDVLPLNLEYLDVEQCTSAQPMLALTKLHTLSLWDCPSAEVLVHIGCLPGLKDMTMHAESTGIPISAAEAAAGALRTLPVTWLTLAGGFCVSAGTLQHLGALQRLTDLSMGPFSSTVHAAPSDLAAALQQLTNLHRLQVWRVEFARGTDSMKALTQAIASLPRLTNLNWRGVEANSAAAVELAAATGLIHFGWMECGLDDFTLNTLAWSLTGLRELYIDDNHQVRDAAMPTLARTLNQLTRLSMRRTRVSDRGLECLARLKQLRVTQEDVSGTMVSAAAKEGLADGH